MKKHFLYATIGHTAAGKTTLCKYLLSNNAINFTYIEEGQIKREIVMEYKTSDSLNERLRDKAYSISVDKAKDILSDSDVLIDASFHRVERRSIIYDMLKQLNFSVCLLWFYCYCPNLEKVEQRIDRRKGAIKSAETQADSISIYNHIIDTFVDPSIQEIPEGIQAAIIYINTDLNRIDKVEYSCNSEVIHNKVAEVCEQIVEQQKLWRCME